MRLKCVPYIKQPSVRPVTPLMCIKGAALVTCHQVSVCDRGEDVRRWSYAARRCAAHTLPVLIILPLGVKTVWGGWGGSLAATGWPTERFPWTGSRWDPTPSSQITANDALVCSHDRFNMTTSVYSNKRRALGRGRERGILNHCNVDVETYPHGRLYPSRIN